MSYIELNFTLKPLQPTRDILVAELSELGFESFIEKEDGLLAYIKTEDYNEAEFIEIQILNAPEYQIAWSKKKIQQQNWNVEWEQNFHAIKIGNDCMVRAPFHPQENVIYDIIIEPKMSFGTGHHETTYMMLEHILKHSFKGKRVLDMGCGTAVLAILAEKRGAKSLDAIDIDSWCYENSLENVARNKCQKINVYQGDASLLQDQEYDIIIANINRNILLQDIPTYTSKLSKDGLLFLSGFYTEDLPLINDKCKSVGLVFETHLEQNKWVATVHRIS